MINSLYKFNKTISKQKYIVISNDGRWSNIFLGIYELEVDGSNLFIQTINDVNQCLEYKVLDIMPILDDDLESMKIRNVLFVRSVTSSTEYSLNLSDIKSSDIYITYKRDNNIDLIG